MVSSLPQSWPQQQQLLPERYPKQPPREPDLYNRGMAPLSEAERGSAAASGYEPKPLQMQRYLPLLGSQEPSHLNATDTLACRSIELFEVIASDLYGEESSSLDQPTIGQVGLRCAFCAETEASPESYIFPGNTRSVGDSIRHAGFEHLAQCLQFPDDYKRQIQEAIWKRKELTEGPSAMREEESNRRALIDFCSARCEQAGIVGRHPVGLVFADAATPLIPIIPHPAAAAGYNIQRRDDPGMHHQHYTERAYGGPQQPPRYYGAPPMQQLQYREPHVSKQEPKVAISKRDDDTALEQTPVELGPRYHQQMPTFSPVPNEFPFFYEHNRWICKFCAHVPPPYRDPQYFWANNIHTPPPPSFLDYHLSICREFQKGMMYEHQPMPAVQTRDSRGVAARESMSTPTFGPPMTPGWEPQRRAMVPTPPRAARAAAEYQVLHPHHAVMGSPYNTPPYARSHDEPPPYHHTSKQQQLIRTPIRSEPQPLESSLSNDAEAARAIEYLEANDESRYDSDGNLVRDAERLVLEEDRLLLTEYFYYLMKQLRLVRFSEADRRTRGGKREKVKVGYGGLQCVHCVDIPNTRKFFWSNVDRLANSFAEIPSHVLKCRRCPQPTKDALLLLKHRHAEQMSRLPRGSQKVFFRRMWRRLHEGDPLDQGEAELGEDFSPLPIHGQGDTRNKHPLEGPARPPPLDTNPEALSTASEHSPSGTSGSDESAYFLQRPAREAAKALVDSSMQAGPPSPSSRVLLAIPEDREWLSDTDCFIRRQLEVFCATAQDVDTAMEDRKYPVKEGQVGIRCIHCALTKSGTGAKGQAVAYPFSISGIYESAREFQRMHLETCENLPLSAKTKLVSLKGASSLSSVLRKYFVLAAKGLGLRDSMNGIRAGAEPVPIGSQAAFAFSESPVPEEMNQLSRSSEITRSPIPTIAARKKRKADESLYPDSKRPAVLGATSSVSHRMVVPAAAYGQQPSESRDSKLSGADPSDEDSQQATTEV